MKDTLKYKKFKSPYLLSFINIFMASIFAMVFNLEKNGATSQELMDLNRYINFFKSF